MKNLNPLLVVVCLILMSCGSSRNFVSDRNPKDIDTLYVLQPLVFMFQSKSGNDKSERSDTLSHLVADNIQSGLRAVIPGAKVLKNVTLDSAQQRVADQYVYMIADELKKQNKQVRFNDRNPLYALLDSLQISYAVGVFDIGMTAKSVADAPQNKSTSLRFAYSDMSCIIFDRKNKNVAFYGRTKNDMQEPCVRELNEQQLRDIFGPYFEAAK